MTDSATTSMPPPYTSQRSAAPGWLPYWRRHTDGNGTWKGDGPPGEDLAALRRGIGRDPGAEPHLWPFYTTLSADGRISADLRAEHVALTLYGVHQQSRPRPMHREGIGVGTAVLALRGSGKFSPEAVDRRFGAAATATSLAEASAHLRGLVTQLRSIDQPLDYTRLFRDLRDWQYPDRLSGVRRRWGGQYFTPTPDARDSGEAGESSGSAATPEP